MPQKTAEQHHAEQVARALRRSITSLLNEFRRAGTNIDTLIANGHPEQVADADWWESALALASSELAGCLELVKSFTEIQKKEAA